MGALLIANAGTQHELTITPEGDKFCLDNTANRRGYKSWDELPRRYKSVRACKVAAAMILGERQNWQEPTPPQENDR